jgi:hypothetical protein
MSLNVSSSKLKDALQELQARWEETRDRWKDEVAQDFDEHHWRPLQIQTEVALRAIDRLSEELARARQDCS